MPLTALNGARLWYDDWNPTSPATRGEPIIFLHGFTSCRRSWGHAPGGAAWRVFHDAGQRRHYRCAFLEARGCGDSRTAPGPYTVEQQARDVLALADYLQLSTFTFAGHSMGGGVGWFLLAYHPQRLKRLIVMAPVPSDGFPGSPDPRVTNFKRSHVLHHNLYEPWTPSDLDMCTERFRVLSEGRDSDDEDWFSHRAEQVTSVPRQYWTEAQYSFYNLRLQDAIERVKGVPVLVIAGATDRLLRANLEDALRLRDGVLHVCSTAGHEVAVHDPAGVALAIHNFMSGRTLSQKMHRLDVERRLDERGHGSVPPRPKL